MVGAQAGLQVGKGAFESVYSKHTHTLGSKEQKEAAHASEALSPEEWAS